MAELVTHDLCVPDALAQDRLPEPRRGENQKQLNALAAHCPGHTITVETYPGREDRYVAQAVTGSARPYLVITTDLSELLTELCGPGEHPWLTRLPRAGGGFRTGRADPD